MESMDYNYFASAPQPFNYLGYCGDLSGLLKVSHDGMGATPSMENIGETSSFPLGTFDYPFDASLGQNTAHTSLPHASVSPPSQHQSLFPNDSGVHMDLEMDNELSGRRSSSEEKDGLTSAQSRRKAQNRAAQRAFRERKERHVRDLEAKLNLLTTTLSSLRSDNERLKLMLQKAQTENEILRATASSSPTSRSPLDFVDDPSLTKRSPSVDESSLDITSPANGLLSTDSCSPARYSNSPRSESHPLSASATWDLLQSHPLYLSGAVDIGEVCERLKKLARGDGRGAVFEEDEVRKVIEEVGKSGGDELL